MYGGSKTPNLWKHQCTTSIFCTVPLLVPGHLFWLNTSQMDHQHEIASSEEWEKHLCQIPVTDIYRSVTCNVSILEFVFNTRSFTCVNTLIKNVKSYKSEFKQFTTVELKLTKKWLHANVLHDKAWYMQHVDAIRPCMTENGAVLSRGSCSSLTEQQEKGISDSQGTNSCRSFLNRTECLYRKKIPQTHQIKAIKFWWFFIFYSFCLFFLELCNHCRLCWHTGLSRTQYSFESPSLLCSVSNKPCSSLRKAKQNKKQKQKQKKNENQIGHYV